ncbi:MAG: gamma carbonic anhydrase family protein [Rhodospirillales bacterium]|tara:strand:- start:735 stop:1259 length:525 start_codon:yes stop_codon:yes gene_type:complete
MKYALGDLKVQTDGDNYWIAPNAAVIGNVVLKKDASIWFGATVRGDNDVITIGEGTQIQDGSVLHADPGFPLTIGDHCTVGHMAMLHGCTIGDGTMVGIGAVVLNGARIGKNCIIGGKALIGEGKEIPDNSLVMGIPGKVVKEVSDAQKEMLAHIPPHYVERWKRYKTDMTPQD